MENIGNYFNEFSSFLPSSITKSIGGEVKMPTRLEVPIFACIEKCNFGSIKTPIFKLCLFISFESGVQIWDVTSLENARDNSPVREIFSVKMSKITSIKFVPPPETEDTPSSPFYQKRPLLILASGQKVTFFSLKTHSEVEIRLAHSAPIVSILTNSSFLFFVTPSFLPSLSFPPFHVHSFPHFLFFTLSIPHNTRFHYFAH